jgi:hypothetical protein
LIDYCRAIMETPCTVTNSFRETVQLKNLTVARTAIPRRGSQAWFTGMFDRRGSKPRFKGF